MKPIDADKFKALYESTVDSCLVLIDKMPTLDVQFVVHGNWRIVDSDLGYRRLECSECSYNRTIYDDEEAPKLCESCGAKMDGGGK